MTGETKTALYLLNRQRGIKLDTRSLRRKIESLIARGGFRFSSLGIILVSDRVMSRFNLEYAGHEGTTDVLSFPMGASEGEIIISTETARRQALEREHDTEKEIIILAAHGILHLSGYDDREPEDRRRMEERTDQLLALVGIE